MAPARYRELQASRYDVYMSYLQSDEGLGISWCARRETRWP
jgi:hypothetical protein